MIAVCPTCHDAIHHGQLSLEDETLYAWKGLNRSADVRGHLYVEPNPEPYIVLGNVGIQGKAGANAFQMSETNRLSFRVVDEDILQLNLSINSVDGFPVVRVVDGHVKFTASAVVDYKEVPGWIRVTAPVSSGIVPPWVLRQMRPKEPAFQPGGIITLLEMRVTQPGQVVVYGVWVDEHRALIATERKVYLLLEQWTAPSGVANLTLVLGSTGNIGTAFGFGN